MKNVKGMIVTAILLIAVVAGYFVANTYAKYVSTVTNTGSAVVAKWAFDTDNTSGTIAIDPTGTIDPSTLEDGKIAPGTSGSFDIALSNANTEVGVDVEVDVTVEAGGPENLKFCLDEECILPLAGTFSGQIAAGETLTTKTIYWEWAYETGEDPYTAGDTADTEDGKNATIDGIDITVNITGTQVQPGAAITSHWN